MCNLYRMTRGVDEVARLFAVEPERGANFAEELYPGYPGLVVAAGHARAMTWGFPLILTGKQGQKLKPKPVTNAREDKLTTGFWLASFLIAYRLVRYFRSAEDIGTLLAGKLLSMILLSFGSILLLSNTIAALSNFFLAKDLDQLAAAPVSPWALYRARLAETALHSSWMVVLLLVPLIGAYGVAYRGGADFVLFAVGVLVPFLLIPAALGSGVTLLLVNVFPARRTRDLLSVIAAMAIAGLVLLFRAARPEQLARPEGFANFMQFVAALDTPSSPWLPSEWVSEAIVDIYGYSPGQHITLPLAGRAVAFTVAGICRTGYNRLARSKYLHAFCSF